MDGSASEWKDTQPRFTKCGCEEQVSLGRNCSETQRRPFPEPPVRVLDQGVSLSPAPPSQAMYYYDLNDHSYVPDYLEADMLEALRESVEGRQILEAEYQQILDDVRVLRSEVLRNGKQNCPLPVNLRRLIWNAQKIFLCKPHRPGSTGQPPCPGSLTRSGRRLFRAAVNVLSVDL